MTPSPPCSNCDEVSYLDQAILINLGDIHRGAMQHHQALDDIRKAFDKSQVKKLTSCSIDEIGKDKPAMVNF